MSLYSCLHTQLPNGLAITIVNITKGFSLRTALLDKLFYK